MATDYQFVLMPDHSAVSRIPRGATLKQKSNQHFHKSSAKDICGEKKKKEIRKALLAFILMSHLEAH